MLAIGAQSVREQCDFAAYQTLVKVYVDPGYVSLTVESAHMCRDV